jgi:succinyl-CoA synthetase beta subunit
MHIHEHQAKDLFKKNGINVPDFIVVSNADETESACKKLGGSIWVVKAQVHAGGRGKGGGVIVCKNIQDAIEASGRLLGTNLVTPQTDANGQPINEVNIEAGQDIAKELYLGLLVDRASERITVLASTEGGMDIEEVAANTPDKILKVFVDPSVGLRPYQANELAFGLKIHETNPKLIRTAASVFMSLYKAFVDEDCSLVEINPLVLTQDESVVALDAKLTFDDNALYRHKENLALRDRDEEDPLEVEASEPDLHR